MVSQRDLREMAEAIAGQDERQPGFLAALMAEVVLVQTEERRGQRTETIDPEKGAEAGGSERPDSTATEPERPGDDSPPLNHPPPPVRETEAAPKAKGSAQSEGAIGPRGLATEFTGAPHEHWLQDLLKREPSPGERPTPRKHRPLSPSQRRPRPFPDNILDPPSQGCWICCGPDHFRRECPRKPLEHAVQYCYRCGYPGTTVRNCPNCREGWVAHM